jgi:DNA end-binding protein Ku
LGSYRDDYADEVKALIEAKVAGQEIVGEPQEEQAPVINLMDALRKSVEKASRSGRPAKAPARGPKSAKRKRSGRRTA